MRSLVALLCGLGAINAAAVKMASKAPFTKAWVLGLGVAVGELHLNLQESRHEDWAVVFLKKDCRFETFETSSLQPGGRPPGRHAARDVKGRGKGYRHASEAGSNAVVSRMLLLCFYLIL